MRGRRPRRDGRAPAWLILLAAGFVAATALIVAASLRRPEPATYRPTPPDPRPVGEALVADRTVTLDARSDRGWVRYDFSRSSAVADTGGLGWDVAARRFHLVVNGGDGFPGRAGAVDLGRVPFDSVRRAPADGYRGSRRERNGEARHPVLDEWYDYSFITHLLTPRPRTYALRTADGRYAKIRILGYYCPGAEPGCITFRYAYQGDGSRRLVP